jgi:putative ABC transport system permease protein
MTHPHRPGPTSLPRLPAALLRALLPVAEREEVLADLFTEFGDRVARDGSWRARLWCWGQVAASLPALVRRSWWRGWTGFEAAANVMKPGGPFLERWLIDARYAARRLVRRPIYATVAVLTLALGIGGTAAAFGIARAVLLDPLPFHDEGTIGVFWKPFFWTPQEFAYLRGRFPGFSQVAQYTTDDETLELGDAPSRLVAGIATSWELFSVLGVHALFGRTFETGDDVPGGAATAVLSYGLWQDLGGDRSIIGRVVRLDGVDRTVVGVMPRGFWFPTPTIRVWVPEAVDPNDDNGSYSLVGRAAPGQRLDRLSGQIAQVTRMLGERFRYTEQFDKTRDPWIRPIREGFVRPLQPAVVATLAAMGLILLIACVNVAALMLGQVEGRATELAIRAALGANRRRLAGQLVAEGMMLGVVSGAVGAALAAAAFRVIVAALPLGAWAETASLDWTVFAVALTVALGSALGISVVPALALWHGRLRHAIGADRTGGVVGGGARLESLLLVAEVALAVLMTAGAGVLLRSVDRLSAIDPGIRTSGVGVVDVVLPDAMRAPERLATVRELLAAVRGISGVASSAVVQQLPLRGGGWSGGILVEGKRDLPRTSTFVRFVSPDYFTTMGIPVRQGRGLEAADGPRVSDDASAGAVVINEAFARKFLNGENPVGRRVNAGFSPTMARIVGVVGNVAEGALTDAPAPVRYSPLETLAFVSSKQTLVFRTMADQDPAPLLPTVRATIQRAAPRAAVAEATTMERVFERAVGPVRQVMMLAAILTGLALVLCAIGIYGVMSHFVARRRRDWGIRIALGLRPARVVSGIVTRGALLVIVGAAVGLLAFVVAARFLTALVYGVGPTDPLAMLASLTALLVVGIVAAVVPATRASRTDPAIVLREQ